ncbi:MAG: hypothetical protein LBN11_06095 [Tannerella sp.]|nr:hypothetical protein [Tannerella sp.]
MKRITCLIASILCLASCNNENEFNDVDNTIEDNRITLNMPDAVVQTYSSATSSECTIDNLWVLEFNSSNALVHDTLILGANILGNGAPQQMLPQLPFKLTDGNKVVLIANSDATTFPHPNKASITYSNINTYFPLAAKNYYSGGEHLPMYGEITSWSSSSYACDMTRAVAKVQVQMGTNPSDITGTFIPGNVTYEICNGASAGNIQPPTSSTTIFATTTGNFRLLQYSGATEPQKSVYLYEYSASNSFSADRQFILIKKTYNSTSTYYRLDFYDYLSKTFLNTERNHHYIFTINNVRSEGYSNINDAKANPGSNIEYEINVTDGSSHITSNGQYAIVTSVDTAYVEAPTTTATTIATARFEGTPNVSNNNISLEGVNPVNSVPSFSPTALTNGNVNVQVTTTAAFESARIKFTLGNITHYIWVKKKQP